MVGGLDPGTNLEDVWKKHQTLESVATLPFAKVIEQARAATAHLNKNILAVQTWTVPCIVSENRLLVMPAAEELANPCVQVDEYLQHAALLSGKASKGATALKKTWRSARDHIKMIMQRTRVAAVIAVKRATYCNARSNRLK